MRKPKDDLDNEEVKKNNVSIIKRFSGGGTVIIDEDSLCVTMIFQVNNNDNCYQFC